VVGIAEDIGSVRIGRGLHIVKRILVPAVLFVVAVVTIIATMLVLRGMSTSSDGGLAAARQAWLDAGGAFTVADAVPEPRPEAGARGQRLLALINETPGALDFRLDQNELKGVSTIASRLAPYRRTVDDLAALLDEGRIDWSIDYFPDRFLSGRSIRAAARLLQAAGTEAHLRQDRQDALEYARLLLRLGGALETYPSNVADLLQVAIDQLSYALILDTLSDGGTVPDGLIRELERRDMSYIIGHAIRCDVASMWERLPEIREGLARDPQSAFSPADEAELARYLTLSLQALDTAMRPPATRTPGVHAFPGEQSGPLLDSLWPAYEQRDENIWMSDARRLVLLRACRIRNAVMAGQTLQDAVDSVPPQTNPMTGELITYEIDGDTLIIDLQTSGGQETHETYRWLMR
jgi:hypothetical protein